MSESQVDEDDIDDNGNEVIVSIGLVCPSGHSHMVYVRKSHEPWFAEAKLAACPKEQDDGWGA